MTNLPTSSLLDAEAEPGYDPAVPQSARNLVDFHLRQLGLGEQYVRTPSGLARVLPDGIGWCRAQTLTEAAWPLGADLCVLVDWFPDAALRRDPRTGHVPPGAEEHWRERLAMTADALESLGYVVERNGPQRSPRTHWAAELLVYRMSPGLAPVRLPPEAWEGVEPIPPHYGRPSWHPDPDPCSVVERALRKAGVRAWSSSAGVCVVRSITQTVWPPDADICAWVCWSPAKEFRRSRENGTVPPGAQEHWAHQIERVKTALEQAGYEVRSRLRPWNPRAEDYADFVVYRSRRSVLAGMLT